MKQKCSRCEKEFDTDSKHKKLCDECKTHTCVTCGKVFKTDKENKKCCSMECGQKYLRTLRYEKVCSCGKEFTSKTANKRYCSSECSIKYRNYFSSVDDFCNKKCRAIDKPIAINFIMGKFKLSRVEANEVYIQWRHDYMKGATI